MHLLDGEGESMGILRYLRIDLIRGVSPDHMLNRLVSSGVVFDPSIRLENSILKDDYPSAICNQSLDIAS